MHRTGQGIRRHRRPQVRQRGAQRPGTEAAAGRGGGGPFDGQGQAMRISQRAERIEPFYVMEVAKAASKLARDVAHTDRPMIFLNIGEPDFTAPPLVQEAAARAVRAGATQYTQATGLEHLRERISGWYAERFGVDVP